MYNSRIHICDLHHTMFRYKLRPTAGTYLNRALWLQRNWPRNTGQGAKPRIYPQRRWRLLFLSASISNWSKHQISQPRVNATSKLPARQPSSCLCSVHWVPRVQRSTQSPAFGDTRFGKHLSLVPKYPPSTADPSHSSAQASCCQDWTVTHICASQFKAYLEHTFLNSSNQCKHTLIPQVTNLPDLTKWQTEMWLRSTHFGELGERKKDGSLHQETSTFPQCSQLHDGAGYGAELQSPWPLLTYFFPKPPCWNSPAASPKSQHQQEKSHSNCSQNENLFDAERKEICLWCSLEKFR